ncbi:HNH endonuclease [Leucobacter soli]
MLGPARTTRRANILDDVFAEVSDQFWAFLAPNLWWLILLLLVLVILAFPILGRGPNSTKRDPWRGFRFAAKETVMLRAGGRCEAPRFFVWGRCSTVAAEVDHVIPWSKGGPTVISNGQALCASHNRLKSAIFPPWWYVHGLERRRNRYAPKGSKVRVRAVLNDEERASRERWSTNRRK